MARQLGLRASEILNTTTGQIEKIDESWVIHVATTKRGNPRSIFISDELKEILCPVSDRKCSPQW